MKIKQINIINNLQMVVHFEDSSYWTVLRDSEVINKHIPHPVSGGFNCTQEPLTSDFYSDIAGFLRTSLTETKEEVNILAEMYKGFNS